MSNTEGRVVGRRAVLGGVAGLAAAGAGLWPPSAAYAGRGPSLRPVDQGAVDAVASRLDRELVGLRREIHAHPELSGQERHTAQLVARRLRAAGLQVRTGVGGHGVVGVLTGARRGRTVAYRSDMDATTGGAGQTAHLCGHDLHTTVGVGVAQVLARLRHRLAGRVVFVFQPAEESLAGAAAMLADGVFGGTDPAEIHALHCGPFPVGQFAVTSGFGMPGLDRGSVTVVGGDALVRAQRLAAEIDRLGTVARPAGPADLTRLVAQLQVPDGPLARFVFMRTQVSGDAAQAQVRVSFRCWPHGRYGEVRAQVRGLAAGYAGASVDFPADPFPAMVSPVPEGEALWGHLRDTLGPRGVVRLHAAVPFNGEDFALFLNRMPGTFTFLGVQGPGSPVESSFPHMDAFEPDERAIGVGVRAMAGWLAVRARG